MKPSPNQHRPFGNTGIRLPPIAFGANALADARRVITDQAKLELCGEWFREVAPPVFIFAALEINEGRSLEMLGRAFRRLEVAADEAVIAVTLGVDGGGSDQAVAMWDEACRRIGGRHKPQLVAIDTTGDWLIEARSPTERDQRVSAIIESCQRFDALRAAGEVSGIGLMVQDWRVLRELDAALRIDWVMLAGGFTIMRHPPELLEYMRSLAERQTAIVCGGVFECDFLVGGSRFDSRSVRLEDSADAKRYPWRKAFAALCHGHGITPAHASIQFALSGPGVAAVVINTSQADRVAENVLAATAKVPDSFWAGMKEEGLLNHDYPKLD